MDEANMEKERKDSNNKKFLVIGSCIAIVLIVLGVLGYFLFKGASTSPKDVFTTAIKTVYKTYNENLDKMNVDKSGSTISIKTDLKSTDEDVNKILEIVNAIGINMNYGVDITNKTMHFELDSTYNDKDLLAFAMDIKNENAYVELKDIYDKTIVAPVEGFNDLFENYNVEDYKTVLENIYSALEKSLKEEYFTSEETTITSDGKDVKVTSNNLVLNEKNLKEIVLSLTTSLNNDEFITSLANITKTDKEEIKEALEELQTEDFTIDETLTISIYTKGMQHEFMGIEMKDESKNVISLLKNTDTNYSYKIKTDDVNLKGTIDIVSKKDSLDLAITFNYAGYSGKVSMNFTYDKNYNYTEVNTNNTVLADEMTENDLMEIYTNIQNNEGILSIIEEISSLTSLEF